jgi:hypothetical protein
MGQEGIQENLPFLWDRLGYQVSIFLFQKGFFLSGQEKEELYLKNLVLQFFVITKKRMCSISITKKYKQRR